MIDLIDRFRKWKLTHSADSDSESDSDADQQTNNDDSDWNLTVKGTFTQFVENSIIEHGIEDPRIPLVSSAQNGLSLTSLDLNRNDQKVHSGIGLHIHQSNNPNTQGGAKTPNSQSHNGAGATGIAPDIKPVKKPSQTTPARDISSSRKDKNVQQQHRSSLDISHKSEINLVSMISQKFGRDLHVLGQ